MHSLTMKCKRFKKRVMIAVPMQFLATHSIPTASSGKKTMNKTMRSVSASAKAPTAMYFDTTVMMTMSQ